MSTHLLFSRMPRNTNSADLRSFCTLDDVAVADVVVRVNKITGRGEGMGFVTFTSVDDAARAAELLAGKQLQGATPQIQVPSPQEIALFAV